MIELAAATWKTDPATAIARLAGNFPAIRHTAQAVATYQQLLENRNAATAFWRRAVDRLRSPHAYTAAVRSLLSRMPGLSPADIPLCGEASCEMLQQLGNVNSYEKQGVILQPLCDLPGRIVGFRTYALNRDRSIRQTSLLFGDFDNVAYTMLPQLEAATQQFAGNVFLMPDTWWAMLLQQRHLRTNIAPLPIVGIDVPTRSEQICYNAISIYRRTLLLVSPPYELPTNKLARLLRLARTLDARIGWLYEQVPASVNKSLTRCDELCGNAARDAVSWKMALATAMRRLPTREATSLLQSITVTPHEYREIVAACPHVGGHDENKTTIAVDNQLVLSTGGDWRYVNGRMVCNADIKIHEIVVHSQMRASGKMNCSGTSIAFDVSWPATVPGLFAAKLQQAAAAAGSELLINRAIRKHVLTIAKQFSRPRVVAATEKIGWVDQQFCFSSCAITASGDVVCDEIPKYIGKQDFVMLPPPGELSGTALSALRGECLPLLLGLLAGVVQSAVAAKLGEQRTRLAIASDGIHDTTKLLLANLGCPPHVGPGTANPHDWPAVVYSPYRGQFAAMVRADNLILLSFRNRCAAAATCGWTVLQDSPVTPSPEFAAAARELPTNYLKSLLSRQLHMERKESLYETILVDILAWWQERGGEPVDETKLPHRAWQDTHRWFRNLAASTRRQIDTGRVYVNKQRLLDNVRKATGLQICGNYISSRLTDAGVLLDCSTPAAWAVPLSWWLPSS